MKFKEIISRLTGISCPVFGVSWNPPEADCAIARRIITFLEDRRVLYAPYTMEVHTHCVDSVLKIRDFLTEELTKIGSKKELDESLRAMRAACRKFLNTVYDGNGRDFHFASKYKLWPGVVFDDALGQLRGVFGVQTAKIAAQYGLDVEDELASILPEEDEC
ncbi:MAG: hypothetical protein PHW74_02510 [Desulfobacca sp.]|nr:hypothetical protein [Desulfobacca sp.]